MVHHDPRRWFGVLALVAGLVGACGSSDPAPFDEAAPVDLTPPKLEETGVSAFAALALDCVTKEYPYGLRVRLESDDDLGLPRDLTPVFYGCYDWHSAVHGHWLLARLTRRFPDAEFASDARMALDHNLTDERVAGELDFVSKEGRRGFERPYGLAWLLQLDAELHEWSADPESSDDDRGRAARWRETLAPLVANAVERLVEFLDKLEYPVRVGEHEQTAFSAGLIHDWAMSVGDQSMQDLLAARAGAWYGDDRDCPVDYEPSGQDFLSPCLAEADFMRRVLPPGEFAAWLDGFMPGPLPRMLEPVHVPFDEEDAFGHLHGLHLSRAWMLQGIMSALPEDDDRKAAMAALAARNAEAGFAGVDPNNYVGSHWLGSFATYLSTQRGIRQ
ncbi:MAG: DUF2891 domain-containing protein [Bacteroidetes bacterium SB0662_bin_6]|nr:DUF2891 domain-containing protein [Bacteroidetes bacterium SB0668_bin_1]MYE05058.1 DUF2891 domain-containing protein [Bacteroidetes bacterium SB0662_bin_6]